MTYTLPSGFTTNEIRRIRSAIKKLGNGAQSVITTVTNGKLTPITTSPQSAGASLHSYGGVPSNIYYNVLKAPQGLPNNTQLIFEWHDNGCLHRDDGPARISEGVLGYNFEWFVEGVFTGGFRFSYSPGAYASRIPFYTTLWRPTAQHPLGAPVPCDTVGCLLATLLHDFYPQHVKVPVQDKNFAQGGYKYVNISPNGVTPDEFWRDYIHKGDNYLF